MRFAKWTVSIAAIVILSTSLWTLMFPLKRQILVLAEDGLLPFPADNRCTLGITLLTGVTLASLMSGLFSMGQLIDLLSVGTLLMFIVMAVAIVMLRYSNQIEIGTIAATHDVEPTSSNQAAVWMWIRQIAGCGHSSRPSRTSFQVVKIVLIVEMCAMLAVALMIRFAGNNIYQQDVWALTCISVFVALVLVCFAIISMQPMRTNTYYFTVYVVTLLSMVSMFVCILLVVMLDYAAWVRFVVWLAAGVPFYISAIRCRDRTTAEEQQQTKWRPGGISKIQSIHNRGFAAADKAETYVTNPKSDAEMKEIVKSDDVDELAVYVEPTDMRAEVKEATVAQSAASAVVVGSTLINKSRTPSPTSSLDDIVLASDIIESLSERKEPNGKVYYVDDVKSVKSLQDTQQQSLDIFNEETLQELPEMKQQTVAVIHIPSTSDIDDQSIGNNSTIDGNELRTIQNDQPLNSIIASPEKSHQNQPVLSDGEEPHLADQPIKELVSNFPESEILPKNMSPLAIKRNIILENHLDTTITDEDNENKPNRVVVNFEQQLKDQESETDEDFTLPSVSMFYQKDSTSGTDDQSSNSSRSSVDPDATSKSFKDRLSMFLLLNRPIERTNKSSLPQIDNPLEYDIKAQNSFITNDKLPQENDFKLPRIPHTANSDASTAQPPPPPVFNEAIYNTINRVKSQPRLPTPDYDDNNHEPPVIRKYVTGPARIIIEDTPGSPTLTFRNKLENILSRELSIRSSMHDGSVRPVSMLRNTEILVKPEKSDVDVSNNNNNNRPTEYQEPTENILPTNQVANKNTDSVANVENEVDAITTNNTVPLTTNEIRKPIVSTTTINQTETPIAKVNIEAIQRALLKDVLKSINPNTKATNSLRNIRRSSNMSTTIENARQNLRHVERVE